MPVHLHFLLILTGLTGINSVTTVSEVSVTAGASVIIPCLYDEQYRNHVKFLCNGYYWSSCSYVVKTNQQNSERFSISDDKSQSIFTVTIKDLTDKDTYYWCAMERDGGSDVGAYFHLTVTEGPPSLYVNNQTITGFKGDDITIDCHYRDSGDFKWCRLGGACVTSPSESLNGTTVTINASVPNVFTVTMSGLSTESSGWYLCVKGVLQMPVHLTVDEQPVTRVHSITTVSKVSVKAGASISIPCLYESRYINHVKGLCEGLYPPTCSYAVKTNRQNSGKFSISDDKSQRIFTVTIKDLTNKDTDYWCAVERDGGSDVREDFHLSVTEGPPSLYVDNQTITGFKGDDITIDCHYRNSGDFKWCRLGGACVTMLSRSFYGTRMTSIRSASNVFTVTMSGLMTKSSGWYLCVSGDLQMPVHLTVDEQPVTNSEDCNDLICKNNLYEQQAGDMKEDYCPPSLYVDNQTITGFKGDDITISCHYRNSGDVKWCRLGGACVTSPSGKIDGTTVTINASVPNVFTVTMSGLSTDSSGWYLCVKGDLQMPVHLTVDKQPATTVFADAPPTTVQHEESPPDHLKIFGIRLGVLIFVVMVTSFIYFMFRRHKQTKEESSATTTVKYEAEAEVIYSNVEHMRKTSSERSHMESEVEEKFCS